MSISSEITVKGPAFAAAVNWVAKWAPSKPLLPVQGGIQIDEVGGKATLTAYSESATARAVVPTVGVPDRVGSRAVVSARLLDAIAGTLGKGDVAIGPGPEGTVQLTQGRAVMTLPVLPEADWPTLPGTLPPIGEVNGDAFATAVKRVGMAAGDIDAKPVFRACMRLGLDTDSIEVMAATGQHAAVASVSWVIDPERAAGGDYAGAVVFADQATPLAVTMMEAAAAFAGPDPVEIGCDGAMLSFSSATRSLTVRTVHIDGGWPANTVRTLISTPQPHAVTMEPAAAVVPLKRAAILRGKEGPIAMTFAAGEIRIVSAGKDQPTAGDDAIDASGYDGQDVEILFNPQYAAEALAAAPGDKVTMSFEAWNKPLIVRCDADPSWAHLVAPMRRLG